jgi:lipopolysaccharide assembly outer membrane protein LptD (OstA)
MKLFPAIALIFSAASLSFSVAAQEAESWEVQALNRILPGTVEGHVDYDMATGSATGTNGVFVRYGGAVLTADNASVNTRTGDVQADGHVRIESGDQLWVGDHIFYNFKSRQMRSEQFRTGKSPVFAGGEALTGDGSNRVYVAKDAFVTTDDAANPAYQVRASRIKIIPGKSVQMWNAILFVEGVPVFYFPYYQRNLGPHANNFTTSPGYRSSYGAYLLNTYTWYLGDVADGKIHLDYRERRGPGLGSDLNLHLGQWGEASLKYYYQYDTRPNTSSGNFNVTNGTKVLPQFGNIPENRQRFKLTWQATPATNLNVKALVNYQSDPLLLHDFFEGDYTANPQPNTAVEVEKYTDNWSLDALATPRVNSFFNQINRLPDVKLTGFRQQVFNTPVYYDSESSAGWYQSFVTTTNGYYPTTNGYYADSATRVDTYHQVTLPWTFFHWLNVTPRAGGRFTYYSSRSTSSSNPDETYRGVFNTGVSTSFKASQLWADATNSFLQVDGLRHIIEPSADYVFVPRPSTPAAQLPQFDGENPALLLSPVLFPDYSSIDSIDSMNVVRFGVRNVLQTKRDGQLEDLLNWNLLLDWRLDPQPGQSSLNDLYSRLVFRPRSWLAAESQLRYDLDRGDLNMAFHQLTFAPNDRWSWGLGHWYLRGGAWGNGSWNENNYITSTLFYRVNDNWGLRATHNFDSQTGRLQEQFYTLYRDLRSWTAALTFRVVDNVGGTQDYTIAFALSLKASPSTQVGDDVVNPHHLFGE